MWECFREALNPEIQKAYAGYCTRAEAPFWVMIPKEETDSPTCPVCGAPRVAQEAAAATARRARGGRP